MRFELRLLALKRMRRVSFGEIARHVGVSRQSVAAWASGYAKPTSGNMDRLAECLGVSAAWLSDGDGALDGDGGGAIIVMASRILELPERQQVIIEMMLDEFDRKN